VKSVKKQNSHQHAKRASCFATLKSRAGEALYIYKKKKKQICNLSLQMCNFGRKIACLTFYQSACLEKEMATKPPTKN
jgi:hypothetical protein